MNNPSPAPSAQVPTTEISPDVDVALFAPFTSPPSPDIIALETGAQCVSALLSSLSISDGSNQMIEHPGLTAKQRSARTWAREAQHYLSAAIVEIKADAQREGGCAA